MNIGDVVWQDHNGLLRLGIIKSIAQGEDSWSSLEIEWVEDEMYEYWTPPEHRKEFYRGDEVRTVNKERLHKIVTTALF
jgi:hypothetical protein